MLLCKVQQHLKHLYLLVGLRLPGCCFVLDHLVSVSANHADDTIVQIRQLLIFTLQPNLLLAEVSSSQRMSKLLQSKSKGKPKQAGQSSQQQALPSVTPAMRQHAACRISHALQHNSALTLDALQAESAASTWESDIFHASNSKSAYLSKLANAVSQVKKASTLAHVDAPANAFEPDQSKPPSARSSQHPKSSCAVSATAATDASTLSRHLQADDLQTHAIASAGPKQNSDALQPIGEHELRRLMQTISGPRCSCISKWAAAGCSVCCQLMPRQCPTKLPC